jgi:hypothetical protein
LQEKKTIDKKIPWKGESAYIIEKVEENELGQGQYGRVYKIKRKIDGLVCACKFYK